MGAGQGGADRHGGARVLACNVLQHGFGEDETGTIAVSLGRTATGLVRLLVADDGRGLPPGGDPAHGDTLGLSIVRAFARQLNATFGLHPAPDGRGTVGEFLFDDRPGTGRTASAAPSRRRPPPSDPTDRVARERSPAGARRPAAPLAAGRRSDRCRGRRADRSGNRRWSPPGRPRTPGTRAGRRRRGGSRRRSSRAGRSRGRSERGLGLERRRRRVVREAVDADGQAGSAAGGLERGHAAGNSARVGKPAVPVAIS